MSKAVKKTKTKSSTRTQKPHAHELCKKAKEALDKANKLLALSGNHEGPGVPRDGEPTS